ncbi:MAG: ribosome silencing factor [Candidatus Omnitrophota bacterium]
MKTATALNKARAIAYLAAEKKGDDIVLMDMRGVSTAFDWFVLISASSSRKIGAISDTIQKNFSQKGVFPLCVEGKNASGWMLVDYGDVVVHVFHEDIRAFYGLERLWADVPTERFDDRCFVKTSRKD